MFTTAVNTNHYNDVLEQLRNPNIMEELRTLDNTQKNNIKRILTESNGTTCDKKVLSNIRDRIGGLNANRMHNILQTQMQNPEMMATSSCVIDAIFYTSPYDVGSIYLNNRIKTYIHNLRQIGAQSGDGYALLADFENAKDMFIIKVSQTPDNDDLEHELFVGLYGTNKLRKYIPNFSYVYGGFKCSPPFIDPDNMKVVSWCLNNTNAVNYVLYENIQSQVSIPDYLKTCSGKDFLNFYMQIIYALRLGLKVIDFTHYDLHTDNVILRTGPFGSTNGATGRIFQIAYETERGIEYISTSNIPTIIDYGFSHIVYEKNHYGVNEYVPYSIYSYRNWIMHDIYKFLMFCCMYATKYNNNSVIIEGNKIFKFFNATEDLTTCLNAQYPMRYALALTEESNKLTIDMLCNHIRTVCNCDFISPTRTMQVLDCEKMCLTSSSVFTELGLATDEIPTPDNIIELYDIAVRLQNSGRENEKLRIGRNFQYTQAMRIHINKLHNIISQLVNVRKDLKLMDIGLMTVDQVLNYNTMVGVRSMYLSVGEIVELTTELQFNYDIGLAVARSYNDNTAITILQDIMNTFNREIRPSLEDSKRIFIRNHQYLDNLQKDNIVRESLLRDSRLDWYWNGRRTFDVVFGKISFVDFK